MVAMTVMEPLRHDDYYRRGLESVCRSETNRLYAKLLHTICTQHRYTPCVRTIPAKTIVHEINTNLFIHYNILGDGDSDRYEAALS